MPPQPPTASVRTTTPRQPSTAARPATSAPPSGVASRRLRPASNAPTTTPDTPGIARRNARTDVHPVTISTETVVTGSTAARLADMHMANFEPLAELAVQRQTRSRDEMLQLFADADFVKIVAWQRGEPVGLGVLTNVLEKVPEISPAFFRSRYPEHAARKAIYFGVYIAVDEPIRGLTLFGRLSTAMWQIPARAGGVLVYDVCEFNRTVFGVEDLSQQIVSPFPNASVSMVDRQSWFVAELPEPIPGY